MEPWVIGLSFAMGLAAFAAARLIERYYYAGRVPRQFGAWMAELSDDARELFLAHLLVAECQARIAAKIGQLPETFEPAVFQAARLGRALEESVYREARARGLVPDGKFLPMSEPAPAPAVLDGPRAAPPAPEAGPAVSWAGGRLVPTFARPN